MKNQALFSSKDKSKKLSCHLLQFLFGALSVWIYTVCHLGFQFSICYSLDKTFFFNFVDLLAAYILLSAFFGTLRVKIHSQKATE